MAKEIRTILWCDGDHGEEGALATGSTRLVINGGKERELDFCEVCLKTYIAPLLEMLAENGQPILPGTGASQPAKPESAKEPGGPCPHCDAIPVSRDALNTHLTQHHDTSLAEMEGRAHLPCLVEGCPRKFVRRQGQVAHVRTAHADWFDKHRDEVLAETAAK
ncbi:MAG: hypothetical protein FWG11_08675 [Promicromonosporaceae bacterium]|nr:hypothetical protein [Promicromonosporaceae bacterium]